MLQSQFAQLPLNSYKDFRRLHNRGFCYRVAQPSNVPSTLTKGSSSGVRSAMIFGNFNDLIIGQWSATDVLVDPYSGSNSGAVRIVVFYDVDIAVRYAESFSSTQDYTTT